MSLRQLRLLFAAVFLVLVALAFFFMSLLEKKVEKVRFGPNAEARANPRLAALKMLERLGFSTRAVRDPEVLPVAGAMVLLPSEVYLDPGRAQRWRDWVSQGGILVMGLELEPEARNKLLDGVTGVVPRQDEETAAEAESTPAGKEPAEAIPPATAPSEPAAPVDSELAPAVDEIGGTDDDSEIWHFDPIGGDPEPKITLRLKPTFVLPERELERSIGSYTVDYGGVVGIFEVGQGYLVVLADDMAFNNERIDDVDHAVFLWHLVHFFDTPAEVVVLLGDRDGLFDFLWRHMAPFLLAVLLLTLFFVWERSPRFGPRIESRKSGQRGLRAHLQAASLFLWRHHEREALIEPLRAEVLRRAQLAIPGWSSMPPAKARAELARISLLPVQNIAEALEGDPGQDPQDFVNLIATLETLRKSL